MYRQGYEQAAMSGEQHPAYGAGPAFAVKSPFFRGQRKRMNIAGICVSLFLPWILFTAIYAVMSFEVHYKQPALTLFINALGLVVVLTSGGMAFNAWKNQCHGSAERDPTWFIFLFITCLVAWLLGIAAGDANFWTNMQPYYDIINLNTYPSVDPSKMRGQQLMDAGRIIFSEGSQLDLKKSMGFKNLDTYCVAPVGKGNDPLATYDFWAVGLNCCSGNSADFHCGEFNNPKASAGLRLMNDGQRAFYRLAVQQAEAAYNIKAVHPLFFHWMQDPIAEMNAYQDDGLKYFLLGMFAHFAGQLFLVVIATIALSKMGYY
jgi:hypothetical protein